MRCRPDRWLFGVPLLGLLWAACAWQIGPAIEAGLDRAAQSGLAGDQADGLRRRGVRVAVDGRDLSVSADAELPPPVQADVERLAAAVPGIRRTAMQVAAPAPAAPFTFEVVRRRTGLTLRGYLPPGEARAQLVDRAQEMGGGAAKDELRSALGAPQRFVETAEALIRIASILDDSRTALTDRSFVVEGTARDPLAYNEAMALTRAMPPGYSQASVRITPPAVTPYSWFASREGGSLTLGGHVPSEAAREALLAAAAEAGLRDGLQDRMQTARGIDAAVDFAALTRRAFSVLARLDSGRVSLDDRVLTIDGRAAARDLLPEIARDLRGTRLPGIEVGRVDLKTTPASPYRFTARRSGSQVVLAGFVPQDADKSAIAEIAARRFPFETVRNDLHLADGAPEGLAAAARIALERLSVLAEGEVALTGQRIRLAGRALYPELADRVRRDFARDLPAGWTGSADVATAPADKALDRRFCEDLLGDATRREPIRFEPGRDDVTPTTRKGIEAAADVLRRCGNARIKVVALIETTGDLEPARGLAGRRAAAVVAALRERDAVVELVPEGAATRPGDPAKPAVEHIGFEAQP